MEVIVYMESEPRKGGVGKSPSTATTKATSQQSVSLSRR